MATGVFTLLGTVLGALIVAYAEWRHAKDPFRLAAIERRLNAHQTAYELCYRMRVAMHKCISEKDPVEEEYQQWWLKNCIFLGSRSRENLNVLFYKWSLYDPDRRNNAEMNDLARCFKSTVNTLVAEVSLPAVAYDDKLFE
jgi:hypothetical protein